jgi:hypothetical protein
MADDQANKMLKELRTIKVCAIIIALASAKATFNL